MNELPTDVDRLLHAERGSVPPAPAGARERVLARLSSTLGGSASLPLPLLPAAAPVAAAAGLSSAAKWGLALLLGGGLPLVSYLALRPAPAPVTLAPSATSAPAAAAVAVRAPQAPAPAATALVAAPATSASMAPPAAPAAPVLIVPPRDRRVRNDGPAASGQGDDSLAAERGLLEAARAALALGNTTEALALCRRHQHRFAAGQLTEERESIAVRALVSAGQTAAAQTRADDFRRRFPRSMFLPAVDAVLQ